MFLHVASSKVALTSMKLISKSDEYEFIKPWLSTGLLTSTGQKWISRRKVLTSAFHFKILEDFVEIFDKQSSILVQNLKKYEGRGEFNIFPLTALCALDVICGESRQQQPIRTKNFCSQKVRWESRSTRKAIMTQNMLKMSTSEF